MNPQAGERNKERGKDKGQANQQAPPAAAAQVVAPQVPPPQEEKKGQGDGDTCPQGLPVLQGLPKDGSHHGVKDPEPPVAQPSDQETVQPVGSPKATEEANNSITVEEEDSDAQTAFVVKNVPICSLSDGKGDKVQLESPLAELNACRNDLDTELENAIAAQKKYEAEALKLFGKPLSEADPQHYRQVCAAVEKLRSKREGAEKGLLSLKATQTGFTRKGRDIWQAKKELAHFQEDLDLFNHLPATPFKREFERTEMGYVHNYKSLMDKKICANNEMYLGIRITFPSQDGVRLEINPPIEATPNLTACVELDLAEDGNSYEVVRVFPPEMMEGAKLVVAGYNVRPDLMVFLLRIRNLGQQSLKELQEQQKK